MKHLIFAFAFSLPLFAGDSLVLTSGDSLSYDPPDTTPWTALDTRRVEMAIDFTDWNCTGSTTSRLWGMGGDLYIGCGSNSAYLYLRDGSRTWELDVSSRGESLIRFSRDVNGSITPVTYPSDWLEIWDADGTDYAFAGTKAGPYQGTPENLTTENASGSQSIGGTGIIAQIHWVKQYSTVLWPGPSSPLPGTLGTGDLGDWDFDGDTLTDSSGLSMTISGSGHTFETTPSINPTPDLDAGEENWVDAPTVRAGTEIEITGTCSTVAATTGCTCAWSDQGGGSSGTDEILFTGSQSACTTTAVFPTFGSYTLRLAVTDNDANTGSFDFEIGAVALDSTDHVVYPTDNIALIVGPQKKFGTSLWPWLDDRRQTVGNWMGNRIPAVSDMYVQGPGTVSVNSSSNVITGSGTDFQNDFCGGDTTGDSTYGMAIEDDNGYLWMMRSTTCNSSTQITSNDTWNLTSDTGLTYYITDNTGFFEWMGSTEAQNFYDNVLAYYAMYYATGLSRWGTWGNDLATKFWNFPGINQGRCGLGPRAFSQCVNRGVGFNSHTGLFLWSEITGNQTDLYTGLESLTNSMYSAYGDMATPSTDIRPSGYFLAWHALSAELDPDASLTVNTQAEIDALLDGTPTRVEAWDAEIDYSLANLFSTTNQDAMDGAWGQGTNGQTLGTGTVTVTNGSPTVTCNTTCNFSAGTHQGKWAVFTTSSTNEVWAGTRRTEYLIESVDSASQITLATNYAEATNSSSQWRYDTTAFIFMQPFIQSMPMMAMTWLYETGKYDGRQRAIDAFNFNRTRGYRSAIGGYYTTLDNAGCQAITTADTVSTSGDLDCQFTATADLTSQNIANARYLLQEPMRPSAYAAKYARDLDDTNKVALASFMDTTLGKAYGKWGGPESDFDESTCSVCYVQELEDNQITFTTNKNKNWGFGFGFGGAYVWDALRAGDPEAESLADYTVPLDIAGVSGAVDADVTLYEPKGTVNRSVNDQTGSTATVQGDSRQGDHLARVIYRDSMGAPVETVYMMVPKANMAASAAIEIQGTLAITGAVSF